MIAEWIPTTKDAKRQPPIEKSVRVVFFPSCPSDPKRAVFDGQYWWTPKRRGIYDTNPTYWLYEPPLPEPPKQ